MLSHQLPMVGRRSWAYVKRMEGCPLCTGVPVGPDDEESSVTATIAHVYDASAYRPLIDSGAP